MFSGKYNDSRNSSKAAKSAIVSEIVSMVQASCEGQAGFIKYEQGRWFECTERHARQQVAAALRDCGPNKCPSKHSFKRKEKRWKSGEAKQRHLALAEGAHPFGHEGVASPIMPETEEEKEEEPRNSVPPQIFDDDSGDDDVSILAFPDLCKDLDFTVLEDNNDLDPSGRL